MSAVQRGPSASRWMEELPNEINTSYPQPTSELLWGPVPVGSVQAHTAQEAPLSSSTVTYPHVTIPATNPALWELATSSTQVTLHPHCWSHSCSWSLPSPCSES